MSSTNRGAERAPRDLYQTPEWVIDIWAKRARKIASSFHQVIDLGCGDGRIGFGVSGLLGTEAEATPIMVDIEPLYPVNDINAIDYLDENINPACMLDSNRPALFASNPPFIKALEFVKKTVEALPGCGYGSVASFLLRLNFLGSLKRSAWLKENPPSALTVLTPRPSFTGKGADSCEYAIFWWDTGSLLPPIEVATKGES